MKIQKGSSSRNPLTENKIGACLQTRFTGTKEKPILASAFTALPKGPSFTQLLTG